MKAITQLLQAWHLQATGLEQNAELLRRNGMLESARGQRIRAEILRQMISELQRELDKEGRAA